MGLATRAEQKAISANTLIRAGERVFAEKSYFGATVRDVAKEAGLNVSLVSYHFGGKEALFARVIEDRLPRLLYDLSNALSAAAPEHNSRALIAAFVDVMLNKSTDFDSGWGYYIQLISRSMSPYHIQQLRPALEALPQVGQLLLDALSELDGGALDTADKQMAIYFIESTLTYLVQDEWVMAARVNALDSCSQESQLLREKLVDFLDAGYQAVVTR